MYDGEFVDGEKEGFGVYSYHDGSRYEGNFDNGAPHGKGFEIWTDGDVYSGFYFNGMKHGDGILKWGVDQALNKLSNTYAIRAPTYFYA